jgi:hypothetical protein
MGTFSILQIPHHPHAPEVSTIAFFHTLMHVSAMANRIKKRAQRTVGSLAAAARVASWVTKEIAASQP